ncbi:hypothetical protein N8D74_12590 [Curtobacterium flaccumfaciens]|uniref:Uncharacterized protein n=1 Tax=Curtobacterium poinsettiae TaxID=159612 RepID=A0A9Q9PAZ8_9MICO|nr:MULTISPECIES: hypothetical protein [Curtobacterium]MBO9039084.1 hypothetical protein [Curtobacterium flaccumfaciens pv. flaccumfaciens]MCS6563389.1 hypothetical protein [Curtobacterium flaccumfaciens pv. poinsettiae]MDT0233982.1 hypothetical protein [Curtobacterium sp. BRB10]UXN24397.1 hypothetical protein N8D74_12590 [Curtobacterium flaccumfaciens]UXN30277.1 hypothetical protein N8D75_08550 [Curtobacterium flaccumfaciens]
MAGRAAAAVGLGVAGVAAGLVARSLVKKERESDGDGAHPEGWKAVTVLGDASDFARDGYPEPLQRLAGSLEIRIDPAPGVEGFEVHARVRKGVDVDVDGDPNAALRAALRDAKQVFETGEILRATPRPHGKRPRTLLGAAVDTAEDDAKGEGVL